MYHTKSIKKKPLIQMYHMKYNKTFDTIASCEI